MLLNLPAAVDDNRLERSALEAGIRLEALARYTIQDRGKRGLLLGYGRVHETALAAAITKLAPTLKALA